MNLRAANRRNRMGGFTLIEVVVASIVLAIALMGILLICSSGIRNARALDRVHVDAASLASELSLTNRLEDGIETGDFGDFQPGYSWEREISSRMIDGRELTNGLKRVHFVVWSNFDRAATESHMTIFLFRPDSPQSPRR